MNYVALKGRLTHDPELRKTKSDVFVLSFTLAVNRDFKDKDGERKTDFIRCLAWKGTAEFVAKYFSKGQEMCISDGTIQSREYTDKDGNNRTVTEVVANKVEFCGSNSSEQNRADSKLKKSPAKMMTMICPSDYEI